MKIPATIRYGIRMLVILSKSKKRLTTSKLSKILGISSLYVRQLVMPLEKRGFIKSFKGKNGGLTLVKSPDKIKLISIFNAYKENLNLSDCVDSPDRCDKIKDCETRKLLIKMSNLLKDFLRSITIKDLIKR